MGAWWLVARTFEMLRKPPEQGYRPCGDICSMLNMTHLTGVCGGEGIGGGGRVSEFFMFPVSEDEFNQILLLKL